MARNEEKHFCNLNKLILLKEKEEYEKAHPTRPRLSTLDSPEEVQKWLPSIKRDIDFYLKKSQVTCYSDAHIEECRDKVVKLEKEFKAFVRKIKNLSPSPLDVIPWTSRPYKRKKTNQAEETSFKEFKRIATPLLDEEENSSVTLSCENNTMPRILSTEEFNSSLQKEDNTSEYDKINWNLMNQPLVFSTEVTEKFEESTKSCDFKNNAENQDEPCKRNIQIKQYLFNEADQCSKTNQTDYVQRIVNYDTSDEENS